MNEITVNYRPDADDEHYGWLELAVRANGFSGTVGFWSHPNIFESFANELDVFPIQRGNPPQMKFHSMQDQKQPTIQLELTPADDQGHLTLTVALSDDWGTKNQVRLTAPASYAWAQRFSQALRGLIAPPHSSVEMTID